MNKVMLMGRLTRDPDIRYSGSGEPLCVARYSLAVDRRFKREGESSADFINCVAFGKSGEFVEKYLRKGVKVAIVGRIQTGSYEKDGRTVYTTDVVVEEHEFAESKRTSDSATEMGASGVDSSDDDGFSVIPDIDPNNVPF